MTRAGATLAIATAMLAACGGDDDAPESRSRLLVVTHTAGFRHASIPVAEQTLTALAAESGAIEITFARSADDVKTMLAPAALEGFAGVVFVNTTGDLGIPDARAFLDWLAAGHAFVGVHSATDTYHDLPAYLAMVGAELAQHGAPCTVHPKVEDAHHPAVAHLAPSFEIADEIYEWKANPRPGVSVLLSLDAHPPDGHAEQNQPGDHPLSWTKAHGRGRVFYTALGHGDDVWNDERFRRHLLGGIRWSLGR